jgi:glycosyltransferase involved in cell wall biosynthesis
MSARNQGPITPGSQPGSPTVLMLLTNRYDPDPRVRQEALALVAAGWRVRILAWDRDCIGPEWECCENVEVERVILRSRHGRGNTQVFFYLWLYLRMFWRGWSAPFDVLHCHDLDTLPLGYLLGRLKRKPVVYDAHESFPDMLVGNIHPVVQQGLVSVENFLIRRIDLLITVGEKLRQHFAERGARNSVVVGNWKPLREYAYDAQQNLALRERLGIPAGAFTIVCIVQLLKDRKIEALLEAVEQDSDAYLLIGGKGALEPLVRERASGNPRIFYLGFVPATEIPAYTCAADVVYYGFDPSNPNARFSAPNKLFEALAAARPLITGDFGEIGDVVRQAGCGVVLPRYSVAEIGKALALLRDPAIWNSMAANAGRFGRAVTNWERGEEILRREYTALLAGSAAVARDGSPHAISSGAGTR